MQTFLPYSDFAHSAACLDRQRLGKQRVEAKQILLALSDTSYGWQSHPAIKMWRGYELALAQYGWAICAEWRQRGYQDTLLPYFAQRSLLEHPPLPGWLGGEALHASHRSNLLRKLPEHYQQFWPGEPNNLAYVWPV